MTEIVKLRFFLLFFLIILTTIHAQDYQIRELPINNNDGSHTIHNRMLFDEDGILWYNTKNGLIKEFETFQIFYPFKEGSENVDVKTVYHLLLDSKGFLWVTTDKGVFRSTTTEKENFQKLHWTAFKNLGSYPFYMAEDCIGNIWMNTNSEVLKISSETAFKIFKILDLQPEEQNLSTYLVNPNCDNILFKKGLNYFIINEKTTTASEIPISFRLDDTGGNPNANIVKNGEIFPEDYEGYYYYKGKKFKVTVLKDHDLQLIEVPLQFLFVSRLKNSVLRENVDIIAKKADVGRKLEFLKLKKENSEYYLKTVEEIPFDHLVEYSAIANDGTIYTSVFDQIYKIKFKHKGFNEVLHNYQFKGNKINISTRDFIELNEREYLVASYEGVFKIRKSTSTASYDQKNIAPVLNLLRSFVKANDSLIIAVGESALIKYDYKNNRHIKTIGFKNEYDTLIFYDIHKLSDSDFLLATNIGLGVYNVNDDKLSPYDLFPLGSNETKFIRDIFYNNDNLYFSTDNDGLFIHNTLTKNSTHINYDDDIQGLPSNRVYISFIDSEKKLWVGTDKGIVCFNKRREKEFTLDKRNGILDENIVGIQEDKTGNIWFSTYNGLYKYNKIKRTTLSYFKQDGLPSNEFNQNSNRTTSNGTLLFGGVNGFVAFDAVADNTIDNIKILPVKAEYFDIEKKRNTILTKGINNYSGFELAANNSSFSIDFSINDFFNINNNRYSYLLEGLQDEWINLGSQNTLKLLSIPPGNYILHIKGSNSKGILSANELSYDIYVPQVLYKRTWFICVVFLVLLSAISMIVVQYNTIQQRKYRMNLMLIELEQKALRAQMNPHFIFNTLNGIRKKIAKGISEEIEDHIVSFSEFFRYTLAVGRRENIALSKEIEYIKSYINLTNYGNTHIVSLAVTCDTGIDQDSIFVPSMILQPLVENSIIHGFNDSQTDKRIRLIVRRKLSERKIEIIVEDNGIGINASKRIKETSIKAQNNSVATQIINERFELMNKTLRKKNVVYTLTIEDISSSNKDKRGTRVRIEIPIEE